MPIPRSVRADAAALAICVAVAPLWAQRAPAPGTPASAAAFMQRAERELDSLGVRRNQAVWVAATYITDDTEALSAEATKNYSVAVQRFAMEAKRFDALALTPALRRKFTLLKLALSAPPPGNPAEAAELTRISTSMQADYGKGSYCNASKNGDSAKTCL